VLALSLAGGRARKVLTGEEIYPFRDLGYHEIGEEELGFTTRELMRLRAAKRTCVSINCIFEQEIERSHFDSRR
jgi:hypothetical protein